MTKAQVGDLIRVVKGNSLSGEYKKGDVLEVTELKMFGVQVKGLTEGLYHDEYEIHRKAGEEIETLKAIEAIRQMRENARTESTKDNVNSPQHYTQGRVEVIDIIEDAVQGADPFEAVCQANIIKYTLRYRAKNGVEDLNKAQWYLAKLITHEQRKIDGK